MRHTVAQWLERRVPSKIRAWYQGSLINRATLKGQVLMGGILLVVFMMTHALVSEQIRKSVNERLESVAALNAVRVQSELDRILVEFENLSRRALVANALADSAESNAYLRPFLAEYRQSQPAILSLALVDGLGQVIASAQPYTGGNQRGIERALREGKADLGIDNAAPGVTLHVAFPVYYNATGEVEGVLVGEIGLSTLLGGVALLNQTSDGMPLKLRLEDAAGQAVFSSGADIADESLQADIALAGFLADHGVKLVLRASTAKSLAYAPLLGLSAAMLALALFAAFAILLMTRKIAESIVVPLADMSHRAMEIAGAGPTGLKELPVTRSDEIGWMGTAFNEMVYSLRRVYDDQEEQVRHRTEELAEARERLAGVLAGIDDVVYAVDPACSRLEYISPAASKVFGYSAEACLGHGGGLRDLALPEDAPRLEQARQSLALGGAAEVRYRIRRADGCVRWVLDRFHLVADEAGRPLRISGLIRDVTAMVEAEASLHLRERALASSSCGVVITDMLQPGQPILYVNDAFERITGYASDEVLGRNCSFLQGPRAECQESLDEIRASIAKGQACKVVIRNYRKNGEPFWNELQLSPLHDDSGRITHYIGVQNDISATIAATHALVDSEQRLALTIDALHEGVWDWNIVEDRLFTSPSWAGILGLDPVVVAADGRFSVFIRQLPDEWVDRFDDEIRAHLAGEDDDFYLEHQMLNADGGAIWVANHGRIVERAADGTPVRMVGTIVDITQRIESSHQIIGLMSQLDSIFTLSPDAFVYFDERGVVSFVNPAFERLTGLKAGDITGLQRAELRSLLVGSCDPAHPFPWFDEDEDGAAQDNRLMYLLRPSRRVLLVSCRGGNGSPAVIYMRDVTRETEVDRMKSEFLTTAAHELRTPMASIMGFAELLMLREFPPERTRDMLSTMHRQSRRLTDLINELLDLARIEARSGKDFKFSRHRIESIVRDAVAAFHIDGDRERMRLHLQDGLPEIDIDPAKMQQAVINLLSNAYKYSPQGGAVDISVRFRDSASGGQVGVIIRDHGIGMTPEQSARVFERFFRADPSGNIPGTGLGMSLVKEIMDAHGGTVEVDSEPGQGTAVSLWLPVARTIVPTVVKAPDQPASHGELTLWLSDTAVTPEAGVTLH